MRISLLLGVLTAILLVGCGPTPPQKQTGESAEQRVEKKCPDVNNRDVNDPCSPLYFKKKGSKLPEASDFK